MQKAMHGLGQRMYVKISVVSVQLWRECKITPKKKV